MPIKLTAENYYSQDADRDYMSVSQLKGFMQCEAQAMAKLNGWEQADKKALLMGNFLHSYFESPEAHRAFKDAHPEILTKREPRHLLKEFSTAQAMTNRLDKDPDFHALYDPGDKEVIVTGKLADVDWMGKLDCITPAKQDVFDLKTTADIHKRIWIPDDVHGHYGGFVEAYGYDMQMAVYQELTRQTFGISPEMHIIAVSKQTPCDIAGIDIQQSDLDAALGRVLDYIPTVLAVKAGAREPERCEQCEYCRETKTLQSSWGLDAYKLID